jgi:23S rRNA-/tRNA-specific pseudouridylate synthase
MKLPLLFSLQLILLEVLSYTPTSIYKYSTALKAKIATTESNLLSYQSTEKEEFDNRPSYIHRAQVNDNHPQKLLEFVYTVFPDVKRTQAKQWLQYNSLLVNDEPQTKHDLSLRLGDWISVRYLSYAFVIDNNIS